MDLEEAQAEAEAAQRAYQAKLDAGPDLTALEAEFTSQRLKAEAAFHKECVALREARDAAVEQVKALRAVAERGG